MLLLVGYLASVTICPVPIATLSKGTLASWLTAHASEASTPSPPACCHAVRSLPIVLPDESMHAKWDHQTCTELITNNAAAALATPIAFSISRELGVSAIGAFCSSSAPTACMCCGGGGGSCTTVIAREGMIATPSSKSAFRARRSSH